MTRDEFFEAFQDGHVVICNTLEERRDVLQFLKDEGYNINSASMAYLSACFTSFTYPNPGLTDRRNPNCNDVCCYGKGYKGKQIDYADFYDAIYGSVIPCELNLCELL